MYCIVLKKRSILYSSFDYRLSTIDFRLTINILYYCILSIISRQEVYTSDILEALRKADLLVVEGTLYPLLSRLKICGVDNHRGKAVINVPSLEAINLTGASKIEYQGNPSVQQSISLGASKIHRN